MVKLFWWKGKEYPNLGDELSRLILERIYGLDVQFSTLHGADMISVGSVLGMALDHEAVPKRTKPLHVVGSGTMHQLERKQLPECLRFHSVRGAITRTALGSRDTDAVSLGDPGILCADLFEPDRVSDGKVGVILHHSRLKDDGWRERFSHLPIEFLDIRTEDYDSFVQQMARCDIILSESLHGLILADAYGIPNTWLSFGRLHSGGNLKFFDYFSSIGRDCLMKVSGVPLSVDQIWEASFTSDPRRVGILKMDIRRAFEAAIKAIRAQGAA
ncbi:polysaccharide pyruvyl transferase family protein [Brachybacterium sp. AOP24-D1-21]|uniref:polysaccharide pyruvyl transferase family protein n=1 Tax=Brachybacterium sp. AOP24-D1-21 TaxID=3457711 RepID=UPI004034B9FF